MEFDKEEYTVSGTVPEFGAIFISNSMTMKECFERRLFGLPSSYANFVKQVKAGMVLFLFDYERRVLHGVFRACSDGAMNIVPRAFSSSGKFPSQVKFIPFWNCSPLSEVQFHNAIKENYFSAKKFHFGLSEEQVSRLLSLFSSRRFKDQVPQRQLSGSKVASTGAYSMDKGRRNDADDRFLSDERIQEKQEVGDNYLIPQRQLSRSQVARTVGYYMDKGRRTDAGNSFPSNERISYKQEVDDNYVLPQRKLSRSDVARTCGYHMGRGVRVDADDRILLNERISAEQEVDDNYVYDTPAQFTGNSPRFAKSYGACKDYKVNTELGSSNPTNSANPCGIAGRDGGISSSYRTGIECNMGIEHRPAMSVDYTVYLLDGAGRVSDDERFTLADRLVSKYHKYDDLLQYKYRTAVHLTNPTVEMDSSDEYQTGLPSVFHHQMEQQISEPPYSTNYRDAIVTSTVPNDSEAPTTNFKGSSSTGISDIFNPTQASVQDNIGSSTPSIRNISYPLHLEAPSIDRYVSYNFDFQDVQFHVPNHYDRSDCRTSMPLQGAAYSKNLAKKFPETEGRESFSESTLALVSSPIVGNNRSVNRRKTVSPSEYHVFELDHGYLPAFPDQHENKSAHLDNNEEFVSNVPLSDEDPSQWQDGIYSIRSRSVHPNEQNPIYHDLENCQSSEKMHKNCGSRASVFSRLALDPASIQESDTPHNYEMYEMGASVDEVMAVLHQYHCKWGETKKSKPIQDHDNVDCLKKKYQNRFNCAERDIPEISDKAEMKTSKLATQHSDNVERSFLHTIDDNGNQIDAGSPFLDFKRRSHARKVDGDSTTRGYEGSAIGGDLSGGQCKRRKLIRPNFRENQLYDCKGLSDRGCDESAESENLSGGQCKGRKLIRRNLNKTKQSDCKGLPDNSCSNLQVHDCKGLNDRGCDESPGSDDLSGEQCKRRKLIRPNFSKKQQSDCKGLGDNSCSSVQVYDCRGLSDRGCKCRK